LILFSRKSDICQSANLLPLLAEKRGLDTWEKIVNFTKDEWFPSRLSFGKFKGRLYQEAREDSELRSWLEMKIFEQEQTEGAKWRDRRARL